MLKPPYLLVFLMLLSTELYSQQTSLVDTLENLTQESKKLIGDFCGTNYFHEEKMQSDSIYRLRHLQEIQKIKEAQKIKPNFVGEILQVPVVVHILHKGEAPGVGSNISDSEVIAGIQHLNDYWRKVAGSLGDGDGVDMEIEFVLAVQDESENETNGINHFDMSSISEYVDFGVYYNTDIGISDQELKQYVNWDPLKYYNVWIVDEIDNANCTSGGSYTAGYAYYASAHGFDYDGSVALNCSFINPSDNTLAHEMGHAFNLFHTFGSDLYTCGDDGIDDTPIHKCTLYDEDLYWDCDNEDENSCDPNFNLQISPSHTGNGTHQDHIHNYMDYTSCSNEFTTGQRNVALTALTQTRSSFLAENGNTALIPVAQYGCTNEEADNYNPDVNTDDGSCELTACPYPEFTDYHPNYTIADVNMCDTLAIEGCVDILACNYDSIANQDDGNCEYFSYFGQVYLNGLPAFDSFGNPVIETQEYPEINCESAIVGCTSEYACNFVSDANINSGDCEYYYTYAHVYSFGLPAYNDMGIPIMGMTEYPYINCNLPFEGCYEIVFQNDLIVSNYFGEPLMQYVSIPNGQCDDVILGCTNPNACNFQDDATINDGTCEFVFSNSQLFMNGLPQFNIDGTPLMGIGPNKDIQCSITSECDCETTNNSPTYLPDGNDISYTSVILLDCFAEGQVLSDVNDILSVDVNMEHSYSGDLDIYLTAPSGVQVQLFAQTGGSTWFGEATDSDATETYPGIGYDYGWSMNPTYNGTMAEGIENGNTLTTTSPNGQIGTTLKSDIYLPLESLEAFLGTQLNGDWSLTIVDNLSIDNGWVFSWGLSIDSSLLPTCNSIEGCTSEWADNYNSQANQDDGSCELVACPFPEFTEYNPNYTIADESLCQTELIVQGCTNETADNYNIQATEDDGSCIIYGCTLETFPNYNPFATTDDLSCSFDNETIDGCTDSNALNYNSEATTENGSCISIVNGCTDLLAFNYTNEANLDDGSCEYSNETDIFSGHSINLLSGWNLIGYSCEEPSGDLVELLAPILDIIIIVKDNIGNTYLPEWNFNGIGNLHGGLGYQLKISEPVSDFNICD